MDVFSNNNENSSSVTPEATDASPIDAFNHKLAAIKNENGEQKYGDLDKALEALQHSQEYIPSLKSQLSEKDSELQALREELARTRGVEETLQKFTTANSQEPQVHQPQGQEPEQNLEAIVNNLLEQRQKTSAEADNLSQVNTTVLNLYGDKSPEFIQSKAQELGLTVDSIQNLAKTSPQAALKLLGVDAQPKSVSSVTTGNIRTSSLEPKSTDLQPPTKSLMRGATSKDMAEYMAEIKRKVYNDLGIQE